MPIGREGKRIAHPTLPPLPEQQHELLLILDAKPSLLRQSRHHLVSLHGEDLQLGERCSRVVQRQPRERQVATPLDHHREQLPMEEEGDPLCLDAGTVQVV